MFVLKRHLGRTKPSEVIVTSHVSLPRQSFFPGLRWFRLKRVEGVEGGRSGARKGERGVRGAARRGGGYSERLLCGFMRGSVACCGDETRIGFDGVEKG